MRSTDLKRWQTDKMAAQLRPIRAYLGRLQARMEKRGFTGDNPLYRLVCKAQGTMQETCHGTALLVVRGRSRESQKMLMRATSTESAGGNDFVLRFPMSNYLPPMHPLPKPERMIATNIGCIRG